MSIPPHQSTDLVADSFRRLSNILEPDKELAGVARMHCAARGAPGGHKFGELDLRPKTPVVLFIHHHCDLDRAPRVAGQMELAANAGGGFPLCALDPIPANYPSLSAVVGSRSFAHDA